MELMVLYVLLVVAAIVAIVAPDAFVNELTVDYAIVAYCECYFVVAAVAADFVSLCYSLLYYYYLLYEKRRSSSASQ